MPHLLVSDRPAHDFARRAVALTLLVAVPIVAILLLARRAAGALAHPLPAEGLLGCGLLLALWSLAAHAVLVPANARSEPRFWAGIERWLPAVVLLLAAVALLVPGISPAAAVGFAALVVVAEALSWRRRQRRIVQPAPVGNSQAVRAVVLPRQDASPAHETSPADTPMKSRPRWFAAASPTAGTFWADGFESISPGQRTAPVHVAFCPPFAGTPHCEAEPTAGPAATVRVAQTLPYDARFDVKLDAPAETAVSVRVEFAAIEGPERVE